VDRPDLDTAAIPDHRVETGNGQGRIEVGRLDHVETGDDLLGIQERASVMVSPLIDHRTALDELVRMPVAGLGVLRRRVRGVGRVRKQMVVLSLA
jgi:hypothetical protein